MVIFSRDWIASEIAVHDCASVNLFLSSRSQCSFGFPKWILRCMFQWNKNEFSWFTHSLGQNASRVSEKSNLSWTKYESLMHADMFRVASSLFRIGPFLPSNTNLSCSFSHGVLTALVFVLHPDSLKMSGACPFPGYCPNTI